MAQTAELEPGPPDPVDCSQPGAVDLPSNEVFGDGSEPTSPLAGTGYASGEGPGLSITARDAFRVLPNGELVIESGSARQPVFVPLTLLPGDSALSIVVAARSGTPAALVQLDELERSYVSDATWKVNTNPGAGYANPGFDDAGWATASDFGAATALPGCEPGAPFPSPSAAHWIGASAESGSVAVLRKVIRVAPSATARPRAAARERRPSSPPPSTTCSSSPATPTSLG